jgi:selenocysteine-specific translation elongation factor
MCVADASLCPAGPSGIQELQEWLVTTAVQQSADAAAAQAAAAAAARPFLFSVDHCFPLKGQGTILTGTVLQVRDV